MLKYQSLLKENNLTLDSEVLDPAFVTKVQDFEAKLAKKALTEEEINSTDEELVKLFNETVEIQEVESPEVQKANHRAAIAEAKEKITNATTLNELKKLQVEFINLPELDPFISKRIERMEAAEKEEITKKQLSEFAEEVKASDYADLTGLQEKYKDQPETLKLIQARLEKEKPSPKDKTIREKLQEAKKRRWSFDELRAIGIKVTGDDMEIEGVTLERQYMFKVYEIVAVDGKPV
jgi:hypothetical protein